MMDYLKQKRFDKRYLWLKNQLLIFGDRCVIRDFLNVKIPVKFIGTSRQTGKCFSQSEIIWGHK